MSDQGSGFPPEQVQSEAAPQNEWQTVPPVSAGGTVPPGTEYPPPGHVAPPAAWTQGSAPAGAGLASNVAGALCYVLVLPAIVFLVIEPYKRNDFVRFHAWQCLSLFGVDLVGRFVLPLAGFMGTMLYVVLWLTIAGFWLYAMAKAYQGERYRVPGVADLAEMLMRSVQT